MTDSTRMQNNTNQSDRNKPPAMGLIKVPSEKNIAVNNKSEGLTDKFLAVAKEKNYLESIILSQNDVIKVLEREKEQLAISLREFTESHKRLKEKLLDFDILRNMEISELKKKIEQVMADNKKLISEKELILKNQESGGKYIPGEDNSIAQGAGQNMHELQRELVLARARIAELELDQDEAKAELYNNRVEFEHLKEDQALVEEALQQKVQDYSKVIARLKTDIDELTSAIKGRIHVIDELNSRVDQLSSELSHKGSKLHEKIPALLEKINSLSQSIDMKMEENSLFAKELFDLNVKISALNDELIEKDQLLIDISHDYTKKKEEIEALHGAHELTLKNLVYERNLLKQESEDLKSSAEIFQQRLKLEQRERKEFEDKLSDAQQVLDELSHGKEELTVLISEKDEVIRDLQQELAVISSKAETTAAEHAESLAAVQEQLVVLSQQLSEKNETLNSLQADGLAAAEKDRALSGLQEKLFRYESMLEEASTEHALNMAALRENIAQLNQLLLEKNELLTVISTEREHEKMEAFSQEDLLREEITHRDEEISRLTARGLEQEEADAKHQFLLEASEKERAALEKDLVQAAERINELVSEMDRMASLSLRQDQSLSDARAEIDVLRAAAETLTVAQAELEKKIKEQQEGSGLASSEREELQKTAFEYQETFEGLKQEIILLNRTLAEKEQVINLLSAERNGLAGDIAEQQNKLDQSLSVIRSLELQLDESKRVNSRLTVEHGELTCNISNLQEQISLLNRTGAEAVTTLKDDLSSYGSALADLRLKLEQTLDENADFRLKLMASQSAWQESSGSLFHKREETLPVYVDKIPPQTRRPLVYILLVLFLLSIGSFFYAFKTGLITQPAQKNPVREEGNKDLTYHELIPLLTRTSATDELKFQATLLTEPLILKSGNPGENMLFDFQKHVYFKISVSAPREGLDEEVAENPYPMITLTAGADTFKPLPVHVKEIKTFYRKEKPVSIMFYCAFPGTALKPGVTTLSLSFYNEKVKSDTAWDLKSLRAGKYFP